MEVAKYACLKDYNYVSGFNTSTCQPSGLWSDPILKCTASVACSQPPELSNAVVKYSSLDVYSVAEYSCIADHKFFGSSQQITCNIFGSWNGLSGSCERIAFYNMSVPFHGSIPGSVVAGWKVEVIGVPTANDSMIIELRYETKYFAIQFDVRFLSQHISNVVYCSTFTEKGFVAEEKYETKFPFAEGKQFNVTFLVTASAFDIYVDENLFVSYQHFVNATLIDEVVLLDSVYMESVKFYYYTATQFLFV